MATDPAAKRSRTQSLLLVAGVSLGAAILITGAWEVSYERIVENERARLLANLSSVIDVPAGAAVVAKEVAAPGVQTSEHITGLFAMLDDSDLLAWVYAGVAPAGYNGPIEFLLGMTPQGDVIRIRVMRHRETPGLGDAIETEKSDWIRQFDDTNLSNPPTWKLVADGGAFHAITGATVTPRALVEAIEAVLQYHAIHGNALSVNNP